MIKVDSISAKEPFPIPQDLPKLLPEPETPWNISYPLLNRIKIQKTAQPYKLCEVLRTDPEFKFISRYFEYHKPTGGCNIIRISCIHNPIHTGLFELAIKNMEEEAKNEINRPIGKNEEPQDERIKVIERWKQQVELFSSLKIKGPNDRADSFVQAKVLPLWHGTSAEVCASVCKSGFAFFGKHHYFDDSAQKGPSSTDPGYFGSGIYFTNSARYASMYSPKSKGLLLLAWVAMREPYPVVNNVPHPEKGSDMNKLRGQGHYQNYNAHYIPVDSIDPSNPNCMKYYPCYKGQTPACDEFVVFHTSQTLARFQIELGTEIPPEMPYVASEPVELLPTESEKHKAEEIENENIPLIMDEAPHENMQIPGKYPLNLFIRFEEYRYLGSPNSYAFNDRRFICIAAKEELTGLQVSQRIYEYFAKDKPYLMRFKYHKTGPSSVEFKLYDAVKEKELEHTLIKADQGSGIIILDPKKPDVFRILNHNAKKIDKYNRLGRFLNLANMDYLGYNLLCSFCYLIGFGMDLPDKEKAKEYAIREAKEGCIVSKEFLQKNFPDEAQDKITNKMKASIRFPSDHNSKNLLEVYVGLRNLIEECRTAENINPQIESIYCCPSNKQKQKDEFFYDIHISVNNGKELINFVRTTLFLRDSSDSYLYIFENLPILVALDVKHPQHQGAKDFIYDFATAPLIISSFYNSKNKLINKAYITTDKKEICFIELEKGGLFADNKSPLRLDWNASKKYFKKEEKQKDEEEKCIIS